MLTFDLERVHEKYPSLMIYMPKEDPWALKYGFSNFFSFQGTEPRID